MAKGQIQLVVTRTNDDKLLLQVQEPDHINKVIDNHMTVHNTVDELVAAFKSKVQRQLQ